MRQALKDGRGKVAKAIRVCREEGIPASCFGVLFKEGLEEVVIGSKKVLVLYNYRIDGVRLGRGIEDINEQRKWVDWKGHEQTVQYLKEEAENKERKARESFARERKESNATN